MTNKDELKLQADCTFWFRNNMVKYRGRFRRVKNETDLTGRQGMIMGQQNKATGIVKGTFDAFFIVEPIVWIEFKSKKGTLSKEQIEFQEMGYSAGWRFFEIRDLETFKNLCYELFGK